MGQVERFTADGYQADENGEFVRYEALAAAERRAYHAEENMKSSARAWEARVREQEEMRKAAGWSLMQVEARVRELEALVAVAEKNAPWCLAQVDRLAAATALLERLARIADCDGFVTASELHQSLKRLPVGAPENAQPDSEHAADDGSPRTDAFLANQPAAPDPYPRDCHKRGGEHMHFAGRPCTFCGIPYQSTAPPRTEAEPTEAHRELVAGWFGFVDYATMVGMFRAQGLRVSSRTEAEQAMLDAMAGLPDGDVRAWSVCPLPEYRKLGMTELARRGLK